MPITGASLMQLAVALVSWNLRKAQFLPTSKSIFALDHWDKGIDRIAELGRLSLIELGGRIGLMSVPFMLSSLKFAGQLSREVCVPDMVRSL